MVAFQGAVDLGYRYIETDVHLSRDGRVVIFHDHTLERLTDGTGKFHEHDWDELRRLDAAHRFDPDAGCGDGSANRPGEHSGYDAGYDTRSDAGTCRRQFQRTSRAGQQRWR